MSLYQIHEACLDGDLEYVKKCYEQYLADEEKYPHGMYENPLTDNYRPDVQNWDDHYICGTSYSYYPLHAAAIGGHACIIEYILANSKKDQYYHDFVDVNCKDSKNKTPFYYAFFNGHQSCMDLLILAGAETEDTLAELKEDEN